MPSLWMALLRSDCLFSSEAFEWQEEPRAANARTRTGGADGAGDACDAQQLIDLLEYIKKRWLLKQGSPLFLWSLNV